MFRVKYFRDTRGNEPIRDYLKELAERAETSKNERVNLSKILEYLKILQNYGTKAGEPYVKHIENDLWELRPGKNRIFFFYFKDGAFVLLHHFIKKTQKTPKREIKQAQRNMEEVIERSRDYE